MGLPTSVGAAERVTRQWNSVGGGSGGDSQAWGKPDAGDRGADKILQVSGLNSQVVSSVVCQEEDVRPRSRLGHSCSEHVSRSCNPPLIWAEDTHLRIRGIYTASKALKSPA